VTRFAFVDADKARFPVTLLCWLLHVSRAGYYAWATRAPSARVAADEVLTAQSRRSSPRTGGFTGP
jgi:putative transposase